MTPTRTKFTFALSAALVATLGFACGPEGPEDENLNRGPVYSAFESAAIELDVPPSVLMAVGYVESRWEMLAPEADLDGMGIGPARWGVMALAEGGTLEQAAEVMDADVEDVKTDLDLNIRAGAALLAVLAEETLGPDYPATAELGDWRDVVAAYTGYSDPDLAMIYVDEVFQVIREGAGLTLETGETIELEGAGEAADTYATKPSTGEYASQNQEVNVDSPHAARYIQALKYTSGRSGHQVKYVVVHTVQGSYTSCINWFRDPRTKGSAHYVVRSSDGEITQMVREADMAWHAGHRTYNRESIGIEHEGWIDKPHYLTEAMYRSSARLVCDIAKRYSIPIDRQHIIGHVEVPPPSTHTDPGRHWDWNKFMAYVRACGGGEAPAPTPTNPDPAPTNPPPSTGGSGSAVVQGVIYAAPNQSARISGAKVVVGGSTVYTNSNGYYRVNVSPGTHTVTASASGYSQGKVTRQVSSGGETWGSMGLRKAEAVGTGRLVGVIYERPNSSSRISGATVTLSNGRTATTDAQGYFAFQVSPGTYTVSAKKSGYKAASVSRRVSANGTVWGSVGLTKEQTGNARIRGVVYESPVTSARISGATVTLSNGASATSDGNGAYNFEVAPGTYRISARKTGYSPATVVRTVISGSEVWGSVGLKKATGSGNLIGVVYVKPNTGDRVAGARVWTSSGQSTTANGSGVYTLSGVPAGAVTVYASADGYTSGAVNRTVLTGKQVWGSVGLTEAGAGTPEDPARTGQIIALAPIDGAAAGPNPTFKWQNLATGTMAGRAFHYRVVVLGLEDDLVEERTVPGVEGGETSSALGFTLPAGQYGWVVQAVLDADETVEYSSTFQFFIVGG